MTLIELQLCDIQGRLFKLSVRRGISSAEFIKVFMKSATAKALDSTYNRMQWAGEEYLLEEVIDEALEKKRLVSLQQWMKLNLRVSLMGIFME